jgi:uncharacterized membrane protein (DUF485 family)
VEVVGMADEDRRREDRVEVPREVLSHEAELDALASRRLRVGLGLTGIMLVVYFGFILLIAFNKPLLARLLTNGLSLGILLGVLVVLATWALTWVYVGWANRVYEPEISRMRRGDR